MVVAGKDMVQAQRHHVVDHDLTAVEHHLLHGIHECRFVRERLLQPLVRHLCGGQRGVPRHTSEGIPVGLGKVMPTPVDVVAHIAHGTYGTQGTRTDVLEELRPHGRQVSQVVGVPQILLRELELHHQVGVLHRREQRTVGFARLEVHRTVLHLHDDVVHELSVERQEFIVRLLGTVIAGGSIDEGTPHDAVGLQRRSQHVGSFGMCAMIVTGTGLPFRVRLHQEAAEVGDEGINLTHLLLPPCLYAGIERVGSLQSAQAHRRSEVHRQIDLHSVGTEDVGEHLHLLQVVCRQHLGRSIHVVQHGSVDTHRRICPGVCLVAG